MNGVMTSSQGQFVGIVLLLVAIAGIGVTLGVLSRMKSNGWVWLALLLFVMSGWFAAWLIPW